MSILNQDIPEYSLDLMSCSAHRGEILHCLDNPAQAGDDACRYIKDGLIVVEDGFVAKCGDAETLLQDLPADIHVISHQNGLIIPGMVDTHVHYPQCEIIASYGTQLIDWLEKYTFPTEMQFDNPDTADAVASFFLQELLRNGTTSALVFGTVHPQSVECFFRRAEVLNLRMICGKVMMDRNAPPDLCDTPGSSYSESQALINRWQGQGRLGYAITPRFAPTSSPEQLTMAGKLLRENPGVHFHTHLSENKKECRWVEALFPDCDDYLDVYDQYDLLGRRSVFAHGLYLSDREWRRLQQTESGISFCPTSNLFIGSGLFNLQKADRFNIKVGLGTDVGGGDSFSMLRTINEAYKIQQLREYNLSPFQALYMATLGGARVLDIDGYIGNFDTGKEADFVVLDYHATPLLHFRTERSRSLWDRLFVLQMLGDDRVIRETWVMGKQAYYRNTAV